MLTRNEYASTEFMYPNGFSSFFWPQKDDFCWILNAATLIALLKTMAKISPWLLPHLFTINNKDNVKRFEEISSINAAIVYGHKINSLLLIYLILHEVDVGKNLIAFELLVACMSSI